MMKSLARLILLTFCLGLGMAQTARGPAAPGIQATDLNSAARELFENKIRPVLAEKCFSCHAGERPQGGLRLDFRGGWETGGKSGPAVVRGDPDRSPLLRAIRHQGPGMPMPLGKDQLAPEVIEAFEQWVRSGAPDPRDAPAPANSSQKNWAETVADRSHWWSLEPLVSPAIPVVKQTDWSKEPVDRFILAKLEASGLEPAPRADRTTLARRLSFVLTGLPPTPAEVAAFVNDRRPDAYARFVDRLLASPHFGEHWARHWMDVVRYTDTYGYEWDIPAKGAWRYRDYLIRAFNRDVPFDQLVREQIAGDLLPRPRIDAKEGINESLIGPMFFQLGEKRHGDSLGVVGNHQEMLNNKIDAFSKAFQGMTVACARCHNHKLDAVAQRDYYALAGVFMSSRWVSRTLDTAERNRQVLEKLRGMKPELRAEIGRWWLDAAPRFPAYMRAAQARVDNSPDAVRLAEGLDLRTVDAWIRALSLASDKKPALEDLLYGWWQARSGVSWSTLAEQYARERSERTAANARDFKVIADFSRGTPAGWSVDGVGLRDGPVPGGDFTVALQGPAAVGLVLPAGLYTNALSTRLNGALRTPYVDHTDHGRISLEAAGGDLAAHRVIVDNGFLTERQKYLNDNQPHWVTLSTTPAALNAKEAFGRILTKNEDAIIRIWVELATKSSNPNFPPRVGLGEKLSDEQIRDPRSWFGITRVVAHDKEAAPADELTRFTRLYSGEPPADPAERYGQWLGSALEAWKRGQPDPDDVRIINWLLERGLLPNRSDENQSISKQVRAYRAVEKQLLDPETVNGMIDADPGYDYPLNIRGVYEDLGEKVPRGYVAILAGDKREFRASGSGRKELAELIASSRNPLTARVFVNRVWHWLFGTGIVATTDDFGHIGERPSHPELLNYLADRFVQEGWSVKRLLRTLVLSQTFQQSGATTARAREVDPLDRLLHHYPLRRLEAESIRDSILAVSGRLDPRLYGEPINPARSKEDPEKRLFSGPVDGDGRRSVYIKMTIMEPPKFLATFNQPTPKIPTGRRDVTTVPAQALAMLNDPFVAEQAEYWAQRLIAAPQASPEERLRVMFQAAFGRNPDAPELANWVRAAEDFARLHEATSGDGPASPDVMQSLAVWKDMAHALFNTKEFLYVR